MISRPIFDLREKLFDALTAAGFAPKAAAQYVPHVTIATIEPGERLVWVPATEFVADKVTVFYAGRVVGDMKLEG